MAEQTDIFKMVQDIVDTPVQLNCPSDRGYGAVDTMHDRNLDSMSYDYEAVTTDFTPSIPWPDPTQEQLKSKWFNQIWEAIKTWDISVPEAYDGYCGANGNHVRHILDAISPIDKDFDETEQWK